VLALHNPQEVRKQRAAAPLFVMFGLLFIVVGALSGQGPLQLKRVGLSAPGTVVNLVVHAAPKSGSNSHAVVRFAASDGNSIQFEDGLGSSPPLYRVGETVRVLYRPDSPAKSAILDRGIWNLLPLFVFSGGGLLLLALGVSMGLQPQPALDAVAPGGIAISVRSTDPSPWSAQLQQASAPPGHWRWALALSVVALALVFAPPSHKTGDSALGVLLCVLAGLVAAFYAVASLVATFLLAGLAAAVATRAGAAQGLGEASSVADWAAAADQSPTLQSWRLRYAHFRRALWLTGMTMLVGGIALMGRGLLTHIAASAH
jgi:hypothetical protein